MAYILQDATSFAHTYGVWPMGNGQGDRPFDVFLISISSFHMTGKVNVGLLYPLLLGL